MILRRQGYKRSRVTFIENFSEEEKEKKIQYAKNSNSTASDGKKTKKKRRLEKLL